MYMQGARKPKLKPAAPIFKLGQPRQAVPVGRTVKASMNTLASKTGASKNQYVYCEHGDRVDQFAPAPATCPVAQVGPYLKAQHKKIKQVINLHNILYLCLIFLFSSHRFKICC
jgi:hypothetical protein